MGAFLPGPFSGLQIVIYELTRPLVLFAGVTVLGRFTNRTYLATLQQLDVASGLAWERQQANEALSALIAAQQDQERAVAGVMLALDQELVTHGVRATLDPVAVAAGSEWVQDQPLQLVLHLHHSALGRLQSTLRDAALGQRALIALRQMQRHWSGLSAERRAQQGMGLPRGEEELLAAGLETASPVADRALQALRAAELDERRDFEAQRTTLLQVIGRAIEGEGDVRAPHELQGGALWPIAHALNVLLDAHQRQLAAARAGAGPEDGGLQSHRDDDAGVADTTRLFEW
jgi:hypothetical protein